MVFGIIGENCSGKSTLAEKIKETLTIDLFLNQSFMEKYVRVSIVIELVTVGTKLEDL